MTMHADRALPVQHRGGPRPQAGPTSGPGFAAAVDPRQVLAGTLHVLDGPDRGQVWRLSPGTYLLGRAPHCDLPVTDPEVSRWHCMVAVTSHVGGRPCTVTVEDRGSSTGTVVDGLPAGHPSVLAPGARIVVGRTTLGWAPAGWNPTASPAPVLGTPMAAPTAPPVRPRLQIPVAARGTGSSFRQRLRRACRLRHRPRFRYRPRFYRRWHPRLPRLPRRHRSLRPAPRRGRRPIRGRNGGRYRRLPRVPPGSRR